MSKMGMFKLLGATLRPKSNTGFDVAKEVQLKIINPGLADVEFPVVDKEPDGSFSSIFCLKQGVMGCKVEAIVDGRYVYGSPFKIW